MAEIKTDEPRLEAEVALITEEPHPFYVAPHGLPGVCASPDGRYVAASAVELGAWVYELPSRKDDMVECVIGPETIRDGAPPEYRRSTARRKAE